METPKKLGIIGKNISYSFSKKYFENKFQNLMLKNYSYDIFDLNDISGVEEIFKTPHLIGLNVTIPYKEKVIPYLDELSDERKKWAQ
jgi:Shikimate 5-dehydrogenase